MTDGKVLSGGMDGKLCLWSDNRRTACIELEQHSSATSHPVSCVVADCRFDSALSCSYNGDISLWRFGEKSEDFGMDNNNNNNNNNNNKPSVINRGVKKSTLVSSSRS